MPVTPQVGIRCGAASLHFYARVDLAAEYGDLFQQEIAPVLRTDIPSGPFAGAHR